MKKDDGLIPSPLFMGQFPEKPEPTSLHVKELVDAYQAEAGMIIMARHEEAPCSAECTGFHLSGAGWKFNAMDAFAAIQFLMETYHITPDMLEEE